MSALLRELRAIARAFAYLFAAGVSGCLAFAAVVGGLTVVGVSVVLIVGIPIALVVAEVFRGLANIDRELVAIAGRPTIPTRRRPRGDGVTGGLRATAGDVQTWRDLGWLLVSALAGPALAVAAVTAVGATLGIATLPLWVESGWDSHAVIGINGPSDALPWTLLALPSALLTAVLIRLAAAVLSAVATGLLTPSKETVPASAPGTLLTMSPGRQLSLHAAVSSVVAVLLGGIWLATPDRGPFWPAWPWLVLVFLLGVHLVALRGDVTSIRGRLRTSGEALALFAAGLVGVWALADPQRPFWPVWPIMVIAALWGLVVAVVFLTGDREGDLNDRIAVLTRTRRDTVDAQADELRRIERDLHDGAQARLVALSMQLGRAEARLSDQNPEEAALIRAAREEAGTAIAELRDLARGIAPPVLADRGLVGAIESLVARSAVPVTLETNLTARLQASVENCAYFVCAEALANVAKHAPEGTATVRISLEDGMLDLTISDDGPGGADEHGGGLQGLRRRVAGLDGRLTVSSAPAEGTTLRAVLPCAS
ncbi:MAG: sensor domain-containing protein [Actinobacteria bacterium]|nr:sensor domain-containing protein [Thermoleophilia bacterium]MCB9012386.1 sensor domain-containing protein [Actinomycetota bacterium]